MMRISSFQNLFCLYNRYHYILKAVENGKNILLEAQLGALRDIDYGIYPYTTSSTPWRPMDRQARNPGAKVDASALYYSTCVGEDLLLETSEKRRHPGSG